MMSKTNKKKEMNWAFFGVCVSLGIVLYALLNNVYYLIGGVLLGLVVGNFPLSKA